MKVALIGATGRIGASICNELLQRGHQVTGITRNPEKAPTREGLSAVKGDITEPEALSAALKGNDAVISSAVFWPDSSALLIDAVKRSGVARFIAVGGAGSLEAGDGKIVADTMDLPPAWKPFILEGVKFLSLLRAENTLAWTFISPPLEIGPGERLGRYRTGTDQPVFDDTGKSHIAYDDYAIALVDELEQSAHVRRRFTVGY